MPAPPTPQNRRTSNRRDKDGSPVKSKAAEGKTTPGKRQPKAKPLDFGKAIGINEPVDIRGKIQKWQTQDGGIITLDDVVAAAPEEEVEAPPSPKPRTTPKPRPTEATSSPKPTSKPEKAIQSPAEKPKVTKPIARNVLDDDVRIASAPKKRVVSDSHWRKNSSPPKGNTPRAEVKPLPTAWVRPAKNPSRSKSKGPAETNTTPKAIDKPMPIGASPRVNTSTTKKSKPSSSGNDERPSTRESESAAAERGGSEDEASSPTSSNPVIKIERVRKRGRRVRGNSPRAYLSAEDATPLKRRSASTLDDIVKGEPAEEQDLKEKSSPLEIFLDGGKHKKRRSGHTREHAEISLGPEQEPVPADPSPADRRRLRHKSYQQAIPGTSDPQEPLVIPETPPKVYGSRIEAWLTNTLDPFVGSETRSRRTSKGSVSATDLSQTKPEKSPHTESVGVKDESVHNAPDHKSGSRSRTRNQSVNKRVATEDLGDKESSPPATESIEIPKSSIGENGSPTLSLKRRGAKRNQHSSTKDQIMSLPLRNLVQDDDVASSAPSSSVDASTVDLPSLTIKSRPDGFPIRRAFPSTGKRLSTIASVETFATKMQAAPPSIAEGSEIAAQTEAEPEDAPASVSEDTFDPNTSLTLSRRGPSAKRKLASHADLISVLSMPRGGSKSIMSARSIRTNRSRLATATIGDLMRELASDEAKYMRELRTLVDGVIPVLLTCVLSKSDSAVAAGLFSRSAAKDDPNVTKPIVDMGIALQRLKSLHKRIPKDDSNALLSWAQSAQRVYGDYVKAWRLGFQDVVVNLAPATDDPSSETPTKTTIVLDDAAAWDEGLPRNEEGYVVNGDGERVDVAFLLKRPLVRLKYLAKTLKGINFIKHSEQAEKMSTVFQNLVIDARKRSNEEKARLEDDAAANIDPTRARDPHSLAPLAGVSIDSTRCVRARDYFDMHLPHSSGQEVDCHVELILRDDAPGRGNGGDVLLCEVDNSGRWLFFPPVQLGRMSARNGDLKGEIVVMIRGFHSGGQEWSEVFSLRSSDEQAGFEWVQMLGLTPIPTQLSQIVKEKSFASKPPRPTSSHASSSLLSAGTESTSPLKSRTPSPREIEVPIGERANPTSKKWGYETPDRKIGNRNSPNISPITPPSSERTRLQKRNRASPISPPSPLDAQLQPRPESLSPSSKPLSGDVETHRERTPRSLDEAMIVAGDGSPVSLKRAKAKRYSRNPPHSPVSPRSSRQIVMDDEPEPTPVEVKHARKLSRQQRSDKAHTPTSSSLPHNSKPFSVWMPLSEPEYSDESDEEYEPVKLSSEASRPQSHRRASSVPSLDLPTIPKLRKSSQPSTPIKEPTRAERSKSSTEYIAKKIPSSAPSKLQKKRPELLKEEIEAPEEDKPPPPPPHRSPSPATPVTLKASNTPQFTPTLPGFKTRRRSSSPLKHEYEPSTATESSGESEEDEPVDESFTSESSEDELEDDVPTPLLPIGDRNKFPKVSPPASIYTLPNGTISPSQSASQSPYRTVPHGSSKASKTIASIFAWSDKGLWESLHPDECSIVITAGLIEAFELTAAHSKPLVSDEDEVTTADGQRPLVALELTPLVPLRRGTALDISIRSPPTSNSLIKTGNNIMFRSRSLEECEALYAMINTSRINNPTYLALQNARGPYGQSNWASAMDRQNAARSTTGSSSSWWNIGSALGRRSSYRASSTRAASVSAATDSSVGTMASTFSALKRFSGGGRLFNIAKSTLSSRDGTRSTGSLDSGSAGSGSGTSTPNPDGTPSRAPGAPLGITNTKIRLYERETQSKWRDMGSARLTIMLPDPNTPRSATRQGLGSPGIRQPGSEKRILILGKAKGETLLDVTLGESCFERVARTGIAVSVWEDVVGPNGEIGSVGAAGGVSGARARVYMIQMKTERECAYSFSLLGKLRY